MHKPSISVTVAPQKSPFLAITEGVHAEIVNIPKFLEAYPFMARFPTRGDHSDIEIPGISHLAGDKKPYKSVLLRSWFVNFGNNTITGNPAQESLVLDAYHEVLRALANDRNRVSFRADPSEEDYHLVTGLEHPGGKRYALLIGSDHANGQILKVTIIEHVGSGE